VVLASNREDAETKTFARWLAAQPGLPHRTAAVSATRLPNLPPRPADPVLGLFPDFERRR
jgi:hypothetical protein